MYTTKTSKIKKDQESKNIDDQHSHVRDDLDYCQRQVLRHRKVDQVFHGAAECLENKRAGSVSWDSIPNLILYRHIHDKNHESDADQGPYEHELEWLEVGIVLILQLCKDEAQGA